MSSSLPGPDIDRSVLGEAADWLVLLQSGEASERDRQALARWRARDPAHEAAWQRAEGVLGTLGQVPAGLGRQALARRPGRGRLQLLGLIALVAPGAWLITRQAPWRPWTADLSTATGEQKVVSLADGTRLVLDTATAVNLVFTASERRIDLLAGQISVTTAVDPLPVPRPFVVSTAHGRLVAVGTRFSVQQQDDRARVAVFDGAVRVHPGGAPDASLVHAGQGRAFTANRLDPVEAVTAAGDAWERGLLLARSLRLGDLVAELARYHRGVLRCDPAIADLLVSGSYSLSDVPASLALLEKTLPVSIGRRTAYWITVQPRSR